MKRFVQIHMLTSYPPANLNRDDLGRPKTARMGNSERLRVSSQSLKRAWRTSDVFESALAGALGTRTKEMGVCVAMALSAGWPLAEVLANRASGEGSLTKVPAKAAKEAGVAIAGVFGKNKKAAKDDPDADLQIEQLAHFTPGEIEAISELVEEVRASGKAPDADRLALLGKGRTAVDVAMFGRMLAAAPIFNVEAAVQVAHALSVHKVAVEDDYFTAVDDLNRGEEDMGAGHLGVTEFAAGLFYLYLCVNRELLLENLGGDTDLCGKALRALVEAAATIAPSGKQNSFASRARASYILAESGDQQPRSLSVAFLKPVAGRDDMLAEAVAALNGTVGKMDAAYGACADARIEMNAHAGAGTLAGVLHFVTE